MQDEIVLKQSGSIEIAFKNDESIEKFESIFIVIKRLIEVATLKRIRLNRITGWSTDIYDVYGEKRCERAIDIVGRGLNKNQKKEKSRQMAWKWISLPELLENDSFTKYFSKYELLEPVVDLYLEILESSEMSIVRVFLNIVQALETYHSRFITNSIEEFQSRIDLVVLKDRPREFAQDDRTFLMANSYKFITLESRLADLLLAEFKVWFDTGDIKRTDFPKVIAKTRNYYIHYDEGIKESGKVLTKEELSIYNGVLLYILEYYLLLELGFSDTQQTRKKLNERWGNPSQTLSLIKMSKKIEASNEPNMNQAN